MVLPCLRSHSFTPTLPLESCPAICLLTTPSSHHPPSPYALLHHVCSASKAALGPQLLHAALPVLPPVSAQESEPLCCTLTVTTSYLLIPESISPVFSLSTNCELSPTALCHDCLMAYIKCCTDTAHKFMVYSFQMDTGFMLY